LEIGINPNTGVFQMPTVWNPTKETVVTKMQGSWFTFKPDAKKSMDEDKCRFITEHRKETGLVILSPEFDPMSESYTEGYDKTPEGQAKLEEYREQGINNMLAYHRDIIRNNQVSLRKDMAKANPTGDPSRMIALEMSKGERHSLEIVAKYQRAKQDQHDSKIKEIEALLDEVGPIGE
jgi:hypothetical protein